MFKAIFWDNDGILVNTEPVFLKSSQEILAELGIELTEEYFAQHSLAKNLSTFDLARKHGVSDEEILKLRKKRYDLYADKLRHDVPVLDGVRETLETLQNKFKMGVVTSSHQDHFDLIMEGSGLRDFFEFFITNDDVNHTKPHPEPYLMALEIVGLNPEECLVIEDSERGVCAAKAAGLSCFAIPTELSSGNDFSKADMVLGSVRELPGVILG